MVDVPEFQKNLDYEKKEIMFPGVEEITTFLSLSVFRTFIDVSSFLSSIRSYIFRRRRDVSTSYINITFKRSKTLLLCDKL